MYGLMIDGEFFGVVTFARAIDLVKFRPGSLTTLSKWDGSRVVFCGPGRLAEQFLRRTVHVYACHTDTTDVTTGRSVAN